MKKVAVFLILLTVWCSGCVRDDLADCPPLQIMVEVIDKNYENIADAEALGMDVRKALLTVWCSGCVRDDLADCPPLQIMVEVIDKNYENIADAEALGMDVRKAEDLPFRSYVNSLYYVITDAEEKVVKEQAYFRVENEDKEQFITLPSDLPYGKYAVTVWGNLSTTPVSPDDYRSLTLEGTAAAAADVYFITLPSDLPYGKYAVTVWGNLSTTPVSPDDYRSLTLEGTAAAAADVYLATASLDYQYGNELHKLGLKRTKGKLVIKGEGFPSHIDYVKQKAVGLSQRVSRDFSYTGVEDKTSSAAWTSFENHLLHTVYAPTSDGQISKLKAVFYDQDVHPGEIDAPLDMDAIEEATDTRIPAKAVEVGFSRNTITLLKYAYDQLESSMKIWVFVNGRWEVAHTMEID